MAKAKATARKPRRAAPKARARPKPKPRSFAPRRWAVGVTEAAAIAVVALVADLAALGWLSGWFRGSGLVSTVLPFAVALLALGIATALLFAAWVRIRPRLASHDARFPTAVALAAAGLALAATVTPPFGDALSQLRRWTDGPAEARRSAIAHQVWAAYRRADLGNLATLLERGRVYQPTIVEAAEAFDVSHEVLMGVAATESSFHPRPSGDGGQGLFQITAIPDAARANAEKHLGATDLDPVNQRHNAYLGAATLRTYLDQMDGDPFLALLAYNIGPRNGGLVSIMEQYGARDFVTIQPYLKNLPRDYPIRVLTHALAYRVWAHEGRLLPYQEGENATRIQRIGIPGLLRADA